MPFFQTPNEHILFGPAPMDWCEANNATTNPFNVEEWHNTWTNIAYVMVGLIQFFHWSRNSPKDPMFVAFCFFVVMTGVASAWFHATLLFVAQKSDEFFENAAMLALTYFHVFPVVTGGDNSVQSSMVGSSRYLLCAAHVIALGVGILFIPEAFCEVHLLICVLTAFKTGWKRLDTLKHAATKTLVKTYFHRSFACAGFGFAFWLVDFLLCNSFVRLLNLHAYAWHFLTAMALYNGGMASSLSNTALEKQACIISQ